MRRAYSVGIGRHWFIKAIRGAEIISRYPENARCSKDAVLLVRTGHQSLALCRYRRDPAAPGLKTGMNYTTTYYEMDEVGVAEESFAQYVRDIEAIAAGKKGEDKQT